MNLIYSLFAFGHYAWQLVYNLVQIQLKIKLTIKTCTNFAIGVYNVGVNKLVNLLVGLLPLKPVFAHCDIPCGIYDPNRMQQAAHTIIRMIQLTSDLHKEGEEEKVYLQAIARNTVVKDEHAEILKTEVRVLWGDYFKEEHLKDYPDLHDLVFKTLKLASKARQGLDIKVAQDLLQTVQQIAEIFYKTKGLEPIRVKSPYPTEGELVLYK